MYVIMSNEKREYVCKYNLSTHRITWCLTIPFARKFQTEEEAKDTATNYGLEKFQVIKVGANI